MSRVQYDYEVNEDVYGIIGAEKSLVTGTTVATYRMGSGPTANQRTETTGDGRTRTFTFDSFRVTSAPDFTGQATTATYDASNFKASRTDALGRVTSFEREAETGAVTRRTLPGGAFTRTVYSNPAVPYFVAERYDELNRKTAYTRDARNNVTRVDYPDGAYETWTFNAFNQPLTHRQRNGGSESMAYDARGLKTSQTDALNNVTAFTYDTRDRLASVTDPLGHATAYVNNVRGLLTKTTYADNTFVTLTYDAYGNPLTRTDELSHTWIRAYDEYNRLVSVTDPLNRATAYSYGLLGGSGCGSCHTDKNLTRVTLPSGKYTTFTYDAEFRRTGVTTGAGTPEAATTAYAYDSVGNLVTLTDPRGKVTAYAYDARNRRLSVTDPLNHKTAWTYDDAGNRLTEKRADNGVTSFEYDVMRRRTRATDPLAQVTQWAYDLAGNLQTLTDARNNAHGFTYDLRNRKTRMTYPGGSHEDWSFDAAGRLATYTTRAGQVKTCSYDVRNRDVFCDWSGDDTPDVSRTYDAAGRLLTLNNDNSALTYTYDNANQLRSETQDVTGGPGVKTVTYAYDLDGNRVTLGYPDNASTVTYTYTARNQLKEVIADGPPPLATYTYDLAGNPTVKALEDGTTATSTYDDANRLASLVHQKGSTTFASFAYALNAVNNRTAVTREDGRGDAYAYDATDQLTGIQYEAANPADTPTAPSKTQGFAYDAVGNRTSATESGTATAYTANALNQYTQVGTDVPTYEANGNLARQAGLNYVYDAHNRLVSVSPPSGKFQPPSFVLSFAYDGRNRCVRRTFEQNNNNFNFVTNFVFAYDGWNLLADYRAQSSNFEEPGSFELSARYVHGARVDELLARVAGSGTVFYHQDGLGSTAALTNVNGAVVERYRYDVFGEPKFFDATGGMLGSSAYGNRFLFTGREWLAEVGLYDYRNRVCSPRLGRFLQADPIRFKGGLNLYLYVNNKSTKFRDSSGLAPSDCTITLSENHFRDYGGHEGNNSHFEGGKGGRHCGYLGCGANQMNLGMRIIGEGVPGMPGNGYKPDPETVDAGQMAGILEPNDYQPEGQVPDDLDAALAAAKNQARDMCNQSKQDGNSCCKEITISIECGEDQVAQEVELRDRGGPLCNTTETVSCDN